MSIVRGHEDLKPKAVVGFEMGYALVQDGENIVRYRLAIGPHGSLLGQPVAPENPQVPDQLAMVTASVLRHRGVDQLE